MSPGEAAYNRAQDASMPVIEVQASPVAWYVWLALGFALALGVSQLKKL